jgi:hypothetical protein
MRIQPVRGEHRLAADLEVIQIALVLNLLDRRHPEIREVTRDERPELLESRSCVVRKLTVLKLGHDRLDRRKRDCLEVSLGDAVLAAGRVLREDGLNPVEAHLSELY